MKLVISTILTFVLALIITLTFANCRGGSNATSGTFPNADIPDILEKTVGTSGGTSFTTGITDNKDYQSYFMVIFDNTTEADYTELMAHYQSASTGTGENDSLLFDWGWLYVTPNNGSITINAYIK